MKNVSIIGHFAFGLEYLDGQTVKTKIVAEELCRRFGEENVKKIDTHGGITTLLKAPFQILNALKSSENVIILPAHNGLRVNAPLLFLENCFFKRKIHYVVIGGWLPKLLKKHKFLANFLKKFNGIYVETETMKKSLEEQGFTNIFIMPNCKKLSIVEESQLVYGSDEPFKLCTFSRVMKEKGIEEAAKAVKAVNEHFGRTVYALDIYGQIDPEQTEWFNQLVADFPEYIKYNGVIQFDKSVEVLKNYFALLFPTKFFTEGIPGTVIDAYAAGVPVIASRWQSCADIIDDNFTGISYEFNNSKALLDCLLEIADKPEIINGLKTNCLAKAELYMPYNAIDVIVKEIDCRCLYGSFSL